MRVIISLWIVDNKKVLGRAVISHIAEICLHIASNLKMVHVCSKQKSPLRGTLKLFSQAGIQAGVEDEYCPHSPEQSLKG